MLLSTITFNDKSISATIQEDRLLTDYNINQIKHVVNSIVDNISGYNPVITGNYLSAVNPSGAGTFTFDGNAYIKDEIILSTTFINSASSEEIIYTKLTNQNFTMSSPNDQNGSTEFIGTTLSSTAFTINIGTANCVSGGYCATAIGRKCNAIGVAAFAHGYKVTAGGAGSNHAEGNSTQALGQFSHAEGHLTVANSYASHTEGKQTNTNNQYSHAEGYLATTSGLYAHAEGNESKAIGNASHSEGYLTIASGNYSHAEGWSTTANKSMSHAEGQKSKANSEGSHVEGYNTETNEKFSHAEGKQTNTYGLYSHAQGEETSTSGMAAHAEGYNTQSIEAYQHVEGKYNKPLNGYQKIVGGGTSDSNRKNIHTLDWNGNAYFAGNINATTYILNNHTINTASGLIQLDENGKIPENLYDKGISGNYLSAVNPSGTGIFTFNGIQKLVQNYNLLSTNYSGDIEIISGAQLTGGIFSITSSNIYLGNPQDHISTGKLSTLKYLNSTDCQPRYTINVGFENKIYNWCGIALGSQNILSGAHSIVHGWKCQALGNVTHAEGSATSAVTQGSHTQGFSCITLGKYAHAQGYNTIAINQSTHSQGINVSAIENYSHAEGNMTKTNGACSHAEGYNTISYGIGAHAEGNTVQVNGNYSHAEGSYNNTYGICSHAEGIYTVTSGDYTHSEGKNTSAIIEGSHSQGYKSLTSGQYSHAEGTSCKTLASFAHAEGQNTKANGYASHTEGNNSITNDYFTHAQGENTIANLRGSHAEGSQSIANGKYSHVEGIGTQSNLEGQHVEGKYNIADSSKIHIIGGGSDNNHRKNIHTLDWNGNAYFAGNISAANTVILSTYNVTNLNCKLSENVYLSPETTNIKLSTLNIDGIQNNSSLAFTAADNFSIGTINKSPAKYINKPFDFKPGSSYFIMCNNYVIVWSTVDKI